MMGLGFTALNRRLRYWKGLGRREEKKGGGGSRRILVGFCG